MKKTTEKHPAIEAMREITNRPGMLQAFRTDFEFFDVAALAAFADDLPFFWFASKMCTHLALASRVPNSVNGLILEARDLWKHFEHDEENGACFHWDGHQLRELRSLYEMQLAWEQAFYSGRAA